jgi:hypothetical protein
MGMGIYKASVGQPMPTLKTTNLVPVGQVTETGLFVTAISAALRVAAPNRGGANCGRNMKRPQKKFENSLSYRKEE